MMPNMGIRFELVCVLLTCAAVAGLIAGNVLARWENGQCLVAGCPQLFVWLSG